MADNLASQASSGKPPADDVAVDRAQTGVLRGYLPIDIALVVPGVRRGFDLFRRAAEQMVLFCAADYRLPLDTLTHLREENECTLFVPVEQGEPLTRHAEVALSRAMKDTRLPLPRRTQILHTTARTIMADILANPSAGDVIKRCSRIASAAVDLFAQSPGALRSMAALFTRDYYTYTHCVHTCVLGVALYRYIISPRVDQLRRFGLGMLLHDAGKSQVDPAILNKPGRLTDPEFRQIQAHPQMGWKTLQGQGVDDDLIRQAVLHHHEKLNGAGYPAGLRGADVGPVARIAAIVDVYDALTTDRPYRPAMAHAAAIGLIRNAMLGEHLDAEYVTHFERISRSFHDRAPAA